MAYGSSELDVAATTVDEWINDGTQGIDLFSSHNPMLAILIDNSKQPGGDYQYKQSAVAEGNQFKVTVFGKGNATVLGVTRANQVNAITPTVTTNLATNAIWPWSHYQGMAFDNYEDRAKNTGKAQMVDLGNMILDQIGATFFDTIGTDLLDNAVGSIGKIQSFNAPLANSTTVAGIDQSDTTNNSWWRAVQDTTAEIVNTQTLDYVKMLATYDCGKATGILRYSPDFVLTTTANAAKLMQELKPAQRTDVQTMIRGGGSYMEYGGMRIFWSDRIVANTVMVLNSTTWTFRYLTKMPEPKTPGWVPTSGKPSMWERGYNWFVGLGTMSVKHNALMTNKTSG